MHVVGVEYGQVLRETTVNQTETAYEEDKGFFHGAVLSYSKSN